MTNLNSPDSFQDEDRRKFLETCGRFAAVTPPAMVMLLSTSLTSEAIAQSGGGLANNGNGPRGNNGFGNGGGDGSPNGMQDATR